MTASTFLAAAPNLIVSNKALRSGQPRYADSKFITKCRGNHEIKMKCNQTHETKMEKYDSDITRELRRRDVLGFGCLVGSGLLMPTEETNAARAEDGSCELVFDPSGLGYCDTLIGTGIEASQGQLIKAHYTGKLENGNVFDSSYGRGKPLIFRVGVGEVIKGWDRGIVGGDGIPPMLSGGKRTLKIPPELGYGVRGAGCRGGSCVIPPNSVLLFDVEFVGKA